MRLLLIDDDRDDLNIFSHAFRSHGFVVEIASDLDKAVRLNQPPDIILLDARVGDGDTAGAVKLLRATFPDARLGILSGLIEPALIDQVLRVASVPFFAKPVNAPKFAMEVLPWFLA